MKRLLLNLLAWVMIAGCSKKESPALVVPQPQPPPVEPTWVDAPAKMTFPDGPVRGRVEGQAFQIDTVRLFGGALQLREGKGVFGNITVQIALFGPPAQWQGKSWEVVPGSKDFLAPSLMLSGERIKTFGNVNQFTMKLAFGAMQDGKLPGQLYLCLLDNAKSYLAGAFTLDVAEEAPSPNEPLSERHAPFIQGKVTVKATGKEQVRVGYVGRSAKGETESNGDRFPLQEGASGSSGSPRLTSWSVDSPTTARYRHTKMIAGDYLVYVNWGNTAADWRWVKLEEKSQLTVDLTVDETQFGRVEVTAPARMAEKLVYLMPLLEGGKLPPQVLPLFRYGWDLKLEAKVKDGKAIFPRVRQGPFRALADDARSDIVVEAGKTVMADLAKEE